MLGPFTALLFCQLVGEIVARALQLPVPGPVIGLVLLALVLVSWTRLRPGLLETELKDGALARLATVLVGGLGLLFVPTGVGVVQQLNLLGAHAIGILATMVLSAIITMIATVGAFLLVKHILGALR